ncbi:unnamed protein product, partial [Didymodactylos carnosus]
LTILDGSGKQSLSRLAASISSLDVFQITLRKGYSITDLKTDLSALYIKAGQKGIGTVFLMTDSQVADENFLVLINDMLASGEIPGLFAEDAVEEITGAIRNEVKSQGIDDTRENIWKYFIEKVRKNLKNDKRYNYTTPKSFLEQITLYKNPLAKKSLELQEKINRLESGLVKLQSCARQVDDLKDKLAAQEVELKQKNDDADKLIKAARATPALKAAEEALNTLDKNNLTELKAFSNPPEAVLKVGAAVMCLMPPGGKIPKPAQRDWKTVKASMGSADQFLEFESEKIKSKSAAAAGLCAWVINSVKFYEVYCEVEPKRLALEKANAELKAVRDKLELINKQVAQLEEALAKLTAEYDTAMSAKQKCQEEADRTSYTISLANRLVGGLASENVRWRESVAGYRLSEDTTPGDVLLITAFVSYMGCFTKTYRVDLMENYWRPKLSELKVR